MKLTQWSNPPADKHFFFLENDSALKPELCTCSSRLELLPASPWPEKATRRNCPSRLERQTNSPEALRPASQSLENLRLLTQCITSVRSSPATHSTSQSQTRPDRNTTGLVLDSRTPRPARAIDHPLHLYPM